MTAADLSDLSEAQRALYLAVERMASATNATVPLTDIQTKLDLNRSELLALLTPPLLDKFLNYREDRPNSPGWLAIDHASG